MGRNLPFLPSCGSPSKTLSFRATTTTTAAAAAITGEFDDMEPSVESVICGLSTDRFFFNPGKTSSILEEAKLKDIEKESVLPLKESVSMMEMESTDPFVDFKKAMQEMVEADEGLKEWDNLQELLSLYLAVNDKTNHGYIIGAFVDLLLASLGSPSIPSLCSSSSSSIKGQEESLLMESGGNNINNNNNNNNNKLMKMISSESPESALSFTSSFASSSETCSSTSLFLSSCSVEDDDDDNHGHDEDHNSPQKASVSVADSDYPSSLKV